jgi:Domain of unknown function (DUF4145)
MCEITNEVQKSHCNKCSHETDHYMVATRTQSDSDAGYDVSWSTTYSMLECCGCHEISLRRSLWHSEYIDPEVEYYPPAISRRLPIWLDNVKNKDIQSLLKEIYAALHNDSRRLALMGARAIVDMIMQEKVGDIGGFSKKLANLVSQGVITSLNKEILDAALEAGSAAAHRGHTATVSEVNSVIDIVENLMQVDILKIAADDLKLNTPPRRPGAVTP